MKTLKTYEAFFQQAPENVVLAVKIQPLFAKLKSLGFTPIPLGGANAEKSERLAIAMPNGYPLFLNMDGPFADRNKGYVNVCFVMPRGAKNSFFSDQEEKTELKRPNNFTIAAMTDKKLHAVIDYYNALSTEALADFNRGRKRVADLKNTIEKSGLEVWFSTIKQNNEDAVNAELRSPCDSFKLVIETSSDYDHVSAHIRYVGPENLNRFLELADDTSDDKKWFNVDFTGGLADCVALHLCYGTDYAVKLWAAKNEQAYGGIGFIIRALNTFPRSSSRAVHIVRLKDLLS